MSTCADIMACMRRSTERKFWEVFSVLILRWQHRMWVDCFMLGQWGEYVGMSPMCVRSGGDSLVD